MRYRAAMKHGVVGLSCRALVGVSILLTGCSDAADPSAQQAGVDASAPDARREPPSGGARDADLAPATDAGTLSPDTGTAIIAHHDASADAALSDSSLGKAGAGDGGVTDASVADGDGGPSDAGGSPPLACEVTAPTSCPAPAPVYADVAAIIELRCEGCHSPRWTGPWPLDTYDHVAAWQDTLRAAMLDCSMPPADAGIAMPSEERMVILSWLRCGLPP
jgi:hypothetical protein